MSISITNFGYLLIPICLLIFILRPRWLLPLTVVLSAFQAGSVINIYFGDYPIGVQPGYFAGILFLLSTVGTVLYQGRIKIPKELIAIYLPLLFFVFYNILNALIIPNVLQGRILILPPREGLGLRNLAPLKISGTNISQTFYLAFLYLFAFASSLKLSKDKNLQDQFIRAYLISGFLVVLIGFYQVIAWQLKFPFPDEIIYSNPGYRATGAIQSLSIGIKRLSSTLAEPSIASYYLSGIFAFTLSLSLSKKRAGFEKILTILSLIALMMTTSTTAYLMLLLLLVLFIFHNIRSARILSRAIKYSLALIFISSIVLSVLWISGFLSFVPGAIREIITEKPRSISFTDRFGTDFYSLGLVLQTFGFGVGWGSNRSSSLLTNVMSNAGLWGSIFLAWFILRLANHTYRAVKYNVHREGIFIIAYLMSILAMLFAGIISVPDTIHLTFWVNLSALIGFLVYRGIEVRNSGGLLNYSEDISAQISK